MKDHTKNVTRLIGVMGQRRRHQLPYKSFSHMKKRLFFFCPQQFVLQTKALVASMHIEAGLIYFERFD